LPSIPKQVDEWIGRRVVRTGTSIGASGRAEKWEMGAVVTNVVDTASRDEKMLFHLKHDDSDSEDVSENELCAAFEDAKAYEDARYKRWCRTEELVRESIAQEQRSKQKHDSGSGNGSRGSAADAKADADADADGGEDEGRGVQGEEGWDGDGDGDEDRDTKRASSSARSASHVKKRKVRADKGLPRSSSQQTPGEYQKKKLRKAKGTPKPKLSSQPKRISSAGLSAAPKGTSKSRFWAWEEVES